MTDSIQKNNYNYVRGQFTFWQIPAKKNNTIMREGKLLPNDRFQTKKIITIMWEGNLLPFDRFYKKIITIMWEQFTTFWQIPDKKNNYNYVGGQFTTFWQIPYKKIITIMWEGNLLPDFWQRANYFLSRFEKKKLQLCERANYYLLTDSRQKK